jgi:predicted membrane protein
MECFLCICTNTMFIYVKTEPDGNNDINSLIFNIFPLFFLQWIFPFSGYSNNTYNNKIIIPFFILNAFLLFRMLLLIAFCLHVLLTQYIAIIIILRPVQVFRKFFEPRHKNEIRNFATHQLDMTHPLNTVQVL